MFIPFIMRVATSRLWEQVNVFFSLLHPPNIAVTHWITTANGQTVTDSSYRRNVLCHGAVEGASCGQNPADVFLKARQKGSTSQVTENGGWKVTYFEKTVTEIKSAATLVNAPKNKNKKWFLCRFSRCQPLTWQCKYGSPWPGKMFKKNQLCQTTQEQWVKKEKHTYSLLLPRPLLEKLRLWWI